MSDTDFPADFPGQDSLAGDDDEEAAAIPRDDNRPTNNDPATSEHLGTAQTVTNDAVAGEPVSGRVAEDEPGVGLIEPIYAENDLADEEVDLDDTVEWTVEDDVDAVPDLGPLADYDALTDEELSGADADGNRIDITAHEGPDLTAENDIDSGAGQGQPQ